MDRSPSLQRFLCLMVALSCAVLTSAFQYENVTHPLQGPRKYLHPDVAGKPFPTGAFWTNFVLGQSNEVVVTYPYAVKIMNHQLHISYPFRVVTSKSIIQGFTSEIAVELGTQPLQIRRFDDLSVTVAFPQASGGTIILHLVRGSPYMTLEYKDAAPVLLSEANILSVTQPTSAYSVVTLGNWHQWLVFSSTPFAWTQQGRVWNGPAKFNGVVRIALALQESAKSVLAAHADVYPTGASITYNTKPKAKVTDLIFSWTAKTTNALVPTSNLLMVALPHHVQIFAPSTTTLPEIQYMTMRGPGTGIVGATWHLQEPVIDIPWDYSDQGVFARPNTPEYESTLAFISAALDNDIERFPAFAEDSYNFGKQFGREARLVLTAHRFNKATVFEKGLAKLQNQIRAWLQGTNIDHFVYDTTYGGLITNDGYQSNAKDFGNGNYNDHHFHYGYFLYGLAVLRRFNASFVDEHRDAIVYILSDIGAPLGKTSFVANFPQRDLFPTARHKDWFVGHSYASGLFPQANGKSQESSSEAINAYYALALFTSLDSDPAYFEYARLLLAMEVRATQLYWHIPAVQTPTIYEPLFAANKMAGVVSEMDVVYSTWFGDRPAYIHGIQVIPVTPITAVLLPESYVADERQVLDNQPELSNPSDIWSSVLAFDNAIVDASREWTKLQRTDYNYDTWSSAANAMHWIASRSSFGTHVKPPTKPVALACFGYPACALAGAFGGSLDCCNTLPGCCPSDKPCCKTDKISEPSTTCHDEPACGILGLSCCGSPQGCCTPSPVTGLVLGCCKQVTKPPLDGRATNATTQCHAQPKCAAAKLECCNSPQGCCVPTASGQVLGCCDLTNASLVPTTTLPSTSCHNEPQCGVLGLECCSSPDGCCRTLPSQPKLTCCSQGQPLTSVWPRKAVVGKAASSCDHNPLCLTAGPDGGVLACWRAAMIRKGVALVTPAAVVRPLGGHWIVSSW
ncbi:hypothetical protein H310_00233 [Aphanomyces invadans]|uniref:glucan endo-1,3-beta-D-glucosidase n=1 Tax=Aphanomyces invadans TaxID=157072 RepID=A0A024UVR1_9STRA|nr:hypothetical protein H310_00233 [Aphanomyces invadans]ETW09748.1 hypothetical protein H310_00233 [Aphanomyces invadans]|eukprot:XP_008861159.1 hypothetical protein H310_00233 [Aphanomyces invadans]